MFSVKKVIKVFIFFLLPVTFIFSIASPRKNQGFIMGRIVVTFTEGWDKISKNRSVGRMDVYIKNRNTGKKYFIKSNKNGVFYKANLPDGLYELVRYEIDYTIMFTQYDFSIVPDDPLVLEIKKDNISLLRTISVEVFEQEEVYERSGSTYYTTTYKVRYIDEIDNLIKMFKKMDTKNHYKGYKFIDSEKIVYGI